MLAAIELGLISDIRLTEDTVAYEASLTADGQKLWELVEPTVDTRDLRLEVDADGNYSTRLRQQPAFYNELMSSAQVASPALGALYRSIFLNMPASVVDIAPRTAVRCGAACPSHCPRRPRHSHNHSHNRSRSRHISD